MSSASAARRALVVLQQYGSMPAVAVRELEDDGLIATDEVKAQAWAEGFEACREALDVRNPYEGVS